LMENMCFALCGRFSNNNHDYYHHCIIKLGGSISKRGNNANFLVVPDSGLKNTTITYTKALRNKPFVITISTLIEFLDGYENNKTVIFVPKEYQENAKQHIATLLTQFNCHVSKEIDEAVKKDWDAKTVSKVCDEKEYLFIREP
jgi:hypothetical protein